MREYVVDDDAAKIEHEMMNHLNVVYGLCCLNKVDSLERIKLYIEKVKDDRVTFEFKDMVISNGENHSCFQKHGQS